MNKKPYFNDKENLWIYQNVATGQYSREATHDSLDREVLLLTGFDKFTGDSWTITTKQLQILLNIIQKLREKIDDRPNK